MADSPSFDLRAQVKMLADAIENESSPPGTRRKSIADVAVFVDAHRQPSGRLRRDHWEVVREYVFHRDDHACRICGTADGDVLDVHHILAVAHSGSDMPSNLILLCANDHRRAQRGRIAADHLCSLIGGQEREPTDEEYVAWLFARWSIKSPIVGYGRGVRSKSFRR